MTDQGDIDRMRRIGARLEGWGVRVNWISGWEERGATFPRVPTRILDHHDASSRKSGEWGALGIIITGRTGIPGPLSQFQVARCLDGVPKLAIVAAGIGNHAGLGGPYAEIPANSGNSWAYGAEKANDGLGEPYTAAAVYATNALFHAVALECGRPTNIVCIGHKEWAPGRKSDPTYSMDERRRQVAAFTPGGGTVTTDPLEEIMAWYANRDEFENAINRAVLCRTPSDRGGAWAWDRLAGIDGKTGYLEHQVRGPLAEFGGRSLVQGIRWAVLETALPTMLKAVESGADVEGVRAAVTEALDASQASVRDLVKEAVVAGMEAGNHANADEIVDALVQRLQQ